MPAAGLWFPDPHPLGRGWPGHPPSALCLAEFSLEVGAGRFPLFQVNGLICWTAGSFAVEHFWLFSSRPL